MMDCCYNCEHAIFDYEEYYGGYIERIVDGCKLYKSPEECEEEDDELQT